MNLYFYRVELKRVIDADTMKLYFDLGFNARLEVDVRLQGFDAPETWRPVNEGERAAGLKMTDFAKELIASHKGNLYCRSTNIDLYGRAEGILYYKNALGEFISINVLINEHMIENHLTKDEVRKT